MSNSSEFIGVASEEFSSSRVRVHSVRFEGLEMEKSETHFNILNVLDAGRICQGFGTGGGVNNEAFFDDRPKKRTTIDKSEGTSDRTHQGILRKRRVDILSDSIARVDWVDGEPPGGVVVITSVEIVLFKFIDHVIVATVRSESG